MLHKEDKIDNINFNKSTKMNFNPVKKFSSFALHDLCSAVFLKVGCKSISKIINFFIFLLLTSNL